MEMTISISASVFFSHFFFPFSNSPLEMKRCFSSDLIQPICTLCLSHPTFGTLWPSDIFRAHYHSHAVSFSFFLPIFLLFFKKKKKKKLEEEFLNVFCTFSTPTSSPAACCLAFFVYLTSCSLLNLLCRGSPMTFLLLTSWYFLLSLLNCFCHYQECLPFSRILYSVLFFSLFIVVKFSYISVVLVINYC